MAGFVSPPGHGSPAVHIAVHIATYVLVAAFVVANRHVLWLWLVALGGLSNFIAITANGGACGPTRTPSPRPAWRWTPASSSARAQWRTRTSRSCGLTRADMAGSRG